MESPSLACPSSITMDTDPGVCSAKADLLNMVNATDNCDQDPTITCNPMSSSSFNISGGIVTCMAEDGSANVDSCDFYVVVVGKSLL